MDIHEELGKARLAETLIVYTLEDFVQALDEADIYTDEDIVTIVRAIDKDKLVNDFFAYFDDSLVYHVLGELGRKEAETLSLVEEEDRPPLVPFSRHLEQVWEQKSRL